jgi:hypothetical protein
MKGRPINLTVGGSRGIIMLKIIPLGEVTGYLINNNNINNNFNIIISNTILANKGVIITPLNPRRVTEKMPS